MSFGKVFDDKKDDMRGKNIEEIQKIKEAIDKEDVIFESELPAKYALLQKFGMEKLKKLCNEVMGREPPLEAYTDQQTGSRATLPEYEEDYIHFIIDEMRFSEIKAFALRNNVSP